MNLLHRLCSLAIYFLVLSVSPASADVLKNHFASISVDGKKVGQVHYTARHDDGGILQELKTRASLSFLGIEVYHHTLHTHEFWKNKEMEHLWGNANENGKEYQLDLKNKTYGYAGVLNQQSIELPENAFPMAVWHYAITEHSLLFHIPSLDLIKVTINKSMDSVSIGKKEIESEKFEFSGEWKATVWFDLNKQFLKWQYKVKGRTVIVLLDG